MRKQARQLENEIDLKLVSFSKLGTGHGGIGYKSDRLVLSGILSMFKEVNYFFNVIRIIISIAIHFLVLTLFHC